MIIEFKIFEGVVFDKNIKIGDIVVCIDNWAKPSLKIGKEYVVEDYSDTIDINTRYFLINGGWQMASRFMLKSDYDAKKFGL